MAPGRRLNGTQQDIGSAGLRDADTTEHMRCCASDFRWARRNVGIVQRARKRSPTREYGSTSSYVTVHDCYRAIRAPPGARSPALGSGASRRPAARAQPAREPPVSSRGPRAVVAGRKRGPWRRVAAEVEHHVAVAVRDSPRPRSPSGARSRTHMRCSGSRAFRVGPDCSPGRAPERLRSGRLGEPRGRGCPREPHPENALRPFVVTPAATRSLAAGRVSASRREGVRGLPRSLAAGPSPEAP
jgi:hypothetical protein